MKPAITDLQRIPGVGKSVEQDLLKLGFHSVADLAGADPEVMYHDLIKMKGRHVDRCMLYVFRCAVYFAGERRHDPELLKWWNWKDSALAARNKDGTRCFRT